VITLPDEMDEGDEKTLELSVKTKDGRLLLRQSIPVALVNFDVSLSGLTLLAGETSVPLSPSFSSSIYSYEVNPAPSSFTIAATKPNSSALVNMSINKGTLNTASSPPTAYPEDGSSIITIQVSAPHGAASRKYFLNLTRNSSSIPTPTLTLVSRTVASLTVSWTTVLGATEYELRYGTDAVETATIFTGTKEPAGTTITGLSPAADYTVWVRAKIGNDAGSWGQIAAPAPIAAPDFTVKSQPNGWRAEWPNVTNATGYDLRYGTTNNFNAATQISIVGLNYNHPGTAGTYYYVWVRSKSAAGTGEWSSPKQVVAAHDITTVAQLQSEINSITNSGTIYLAPSSEILISATIVVGTKTITIVPGTGVNVTLKRGNISPAFRIHQGGTLKFGCAGMQEALHIDAGTTKQYGSGEIIYVGDASTGSHPTSNVYAYDNVFIEKLNTQPSYLGHAVHVARAGIFTLDGGTIQNNRGSITGSGVNVEGGTFNFLSGTITDNSAVDYGAGIYVGNYIDKGTLNLAGGFFNDNDSTFGGSLYLKSEVILMINGVTAPNNWAGVFPVTMFDNTQANDWGGRTGYPTGQ
jgi:hypothetical protein